MGRRMAAFLGTYDMILSTALAGPPPKLGYFDQNGDVATFTERVSQYLSVTPLHNATGTPAISVPVHWTADGLPVGVHFAGRYGEEALLLQLAGRLETAQPSFDRLRRFSVSGAWWQATGTGDGQRSGRATGAVVGWLVGCNYVPAYASNRMRSGRPRLDPRRSTVSSRMRRAWASMR